MTRLSRTELSEIGQIVMLANTPLSLYEALVSTTAVRKLTGDSPVDLSEAYDRITAKGPHSEIGAALAYAILTAILLQGREGKLTRVDETRLKWGEEIANYFKRSTIVTTTTTIPTEPDERWPSVITSDSSPSRGIVGWDGRPLQKTQKYD